MARQFIILEREFTHGRSLDDDGHERLRIGPTEPTVLSFLDLDVMCHHELLRSLGDVRKLPCIPWHRRLAANQLRPPLR